MKNKTIRRLDDSLNMIMGLIRVKLYKRQVLKAKPYVLTKEKELRKQHKLALKAPNDLEINRVAATRSNPNMSWRVQSESKRDSSYVIQLTPQQEKCRCLNKCSECEFVCLHIIKCDCTTYSIQSVVCKHIHYLIQKEKIDLYPVTTTIENDEPVYGSEVEDMMDQNVFESDTMQICQELNQNSEVFEGKENETCFVSENASTPETASPEHIVSKVARCRPEEDLGEAKARAIAQVSLYIQEAETIQELKAAELMTKKIPAAIRAERNIMNVSRPALHEMKQNTLEILKNYNRPQNRW